LLTVYAAKAETETQPQQLFNTAIDIYNKSHDDLRGT
jgi:hypothetical protein